METLLIIPLFTVMGLAIGLIRLFTPFGLLYALPVIILIATAVIAYKKQRKKAASVLAYAAAIGSWLSLLSWIASRKGIAATEATRTWGMDLPSAAISGFPIKALEIPPPPMGSDAIPVDMWSGVFTNHITWMAIAVIIAIIIVTAKKKLPSRFPVIPVIIAIAGLLYNLTLFVLWFD